jgi:molybdopterin-guanine dinucleotide biosynthesis protein A
MRASPPRGLPLTVLILAGGRSRRMGRDKARLKVRGVRVIDMLVDYFKPRCRKVLVASGSRPIPDLKAPQVRDPGTQGPLAGLAAGLAASRTSWVLAVTCDQLPLPEPALDRLWKARRGVKAVTLAQRGKPSRFPIPIPCPFPGLYARALLPALRRLLAEGKGPSALPARRLRGPSPRGWNTQAEFRRVSRHLTHAPAPPRMRP